MANRVRSTPGWLFSPAMDGLAFGGSTAFALIAVLLGKWLGLWSKPFPLWAWCMTVVMVDVAHVWATLFRVYFDRDELKRRPWLYFGAPVFCYAAGVALYALGGSLTFWRVLAYFAVWHFVRQQLGWLAIYHRLNRIQLKKDITLDRVTLLLSMVFPLVYWHSREDRAFHWFIDGDFVLGISSKITMVVGVVFAATTMLWVLRQLQRCRVNTASTEPIPPKGVWLLIACTALCWNTGIVLLNNDWAFTWTNVLLHGVPYGMFLWRYARNRYSLSNNRMVEGVGYVPDEPNLPALLVQVGVGGFILFLASLAFAEEVLWDQLVWHERLPSMLSEATMQILRSPAKLQWIVPLLAVPQATHYVLDGFIWKSKSNGAALSEHLGFAVRQ